MLVSGQGKKAKLISAKNTREKIKLLVKDVFLQKCLMYDCKYTVIQNKRIVNISNKRINVN